MLSWRLAAAVSKRVAPEGGLSCKQQKKNMMWHVSSVV
jgi:hypothetical protein